VSTNYASDELQPSEEFQSQVRETILRGCLGQTACNTNKKDFMVRWIWSKVQKVSVWEVSELAADLRC
jgi:hypothetical protein